MTDGSRRPNVMHCPYHTFAALKNFADILQRQHALVDPMQVDDVGFLEFWQSGDVCTAVGDVYLEQMVALQVQMQPDTETFPHEMPVKSPCLG